MRDVRQAAEQVFLLQAEPDEAHRPVKRNVTQTPSHLQHDREAAGIVIGARRSLHRVIMSGDNQRRLRRNGRRMGRQHCGDHIAIIPTQRIKDLKGYVQADGFEFFGEIADCLLESGGGRDRMTLADECLEMNEEAIAHSARSRAFAKKAPAARISPMARLQSPGAASIPRTASSNTTTRKPNLQASRTVCLTQ